MQKEEERTIQEEKEYLRNTIKMWSNALIIICYIIAGIMLISLWINWVRYALLLMIGIIIIYTTKLRKDIKKKTEEEKENDEVD